MGAGLQTQLGVAEEVYQNEVQRISGTPSGVFGLNFDGALTITTLATNASAAAIQAALEALPNIGTGGVTCTGGPLPTAVDVTFAGPLVRNRNVPTLAVQGAVTGLTFATLTPGTGYGDVVTPARFSEYVSEGLKADQPRIQTSGLRSGNTVQRTDRQTINKKGAAGDVDLEVADRGFGLFWKAALGASAITTPGGATNTRDHTYTLGSPDGKSQTFQKGVPPTTPGAAVAPFTYPGTKVADWELSQELDAFLHLKLTLDALDEDVVTALAAAAYPASQSIFHHAQVGITIAGANMDNLKRAGVQCNRNLKTDRHFLRGNTRKKEPLQNGLNELQGGFDGEFTDMSQYTRFTNGTIVPIVMTWTGALIESTFSFQLVVTLPACRFDGETPVVGGPDLVEYSWPFTVLNDGSNPPITILARNTDTAD